MRDKIAFTVRLLALMVAFCAAVNQKNQQIENVIGEKTVVAFHEQSAQTVLSNQLVGIVVELFYTRLFIDE